jgi:hypothetical protein
MIMILFTIYFEGGRIVGNRGMEQIDRGKGQGRVGEVGTDEEEKNILNKFISDYNMAVL